MFFLEKNNCIVKLTFDRKHGKISAWFRWCFSTAFSTTEKSSTIVFISSSLSFFYGSIFNDVPDLFVFPEVAVCFWRIICLSVHVLVFLRLQSWKKDLILSCWFSRANVWHECKITEVDNTWFLENWTYILKRRKKKDNYEAFC